MYTLLIDTSHSVLAVGILKDDKILASKQQIVSKQQSELLIPFIDEVIQHSNVTPLDISSLVVTNGPGSYTGMRIGMTFAKVFALSNPKLELFTINTLLSISGRENEFAFIDARSKRVFGAFVKNGVLEHEKIYTLSELNDITEPMVGDVTLIGKDNNDYGDVIANIASHKTSWVRVENPDLLTPEYAK